MFKCLAENHKEILLDCCMGLKTLAFTQVSCYGQDFAHLNLNVRKQMSSVSW